MKVVDHVSQLLWFRRFENGLPLYRRSVLRFSTWTNRILFPFTWGKVDGVFFLRDPDDVRTVGESDGRTVGSSTSVVVGVGCGYGVWVRQGSWRKQGTEEL